MVDLIGKILMLDSTVLAALQKASAERAGVAHVLTPSMSQGVLV